jgi:hypothetical protein
VACLLISFPQQLQRDIPAALQLPVDDREDPAADGSEQYLIAGLLGGRVSGAAGGASGAPGWRQRQSLPSGFGERHAGGQVAVMVRQDVGLDAALNCRSGGARPERRPLWALAYWK